MPDASQSPRWNFYARNDNPEHEKIALTIVNYDGPGAHSTELDPDLTRCQLRQLIEDLAGSLVEYRRSYRQLDDRLTRATPSPGAIAPAAYTTWTISTSSTSPARPG